MPISWGAAQALCMEFDWKRIRAIAAGKVAATLQELPAPLRERAQALPVTLEPYPNAAHCRDGIEPDTLGLFVGPEFGDEELTSVPLPPQIILFLENIWDQAEGNESDFLDEVRITFLHELGHYLGLNEADLVDRGLE